jgi:DNA-binding IclR family transcriptional regulator
VDQNVLEFADELGTSVGKALAIIKAFDSGAPTLGVSEIARRVNLPKSTAFRLLGTLERNGFVERRGSGYCIGRRLFELGNLTWYCRPRSLRDVALPFMVELVENTHQTVHLAVLDGTDVLYVEKLYGHTSVTAPSYVGGRVPARCAAIGKAMIAFSGEHVVDEVLAQPIERRTSYTNVDDRLFVQELDRIRASGVAFDHEEARLGLTCVGAPIRRRDQTIAAISIAGQTARFDPKQVTTNLLRISAAITKQLSS